MKTWTFGLEDVPWPSGPSGNLLWLPVAGLRPAREGAPDDVAAARTLVRQAQRRWHPDKFVQRVGKWLREEEADAVMQRVKETAQAINLLTQRQQGH